MKHRDEKLHAMGVLLSCGDRKVVYRDNINICFLFKFFFIFSSVFLSGDSHFLGGLDCNGVL